MPKYPKEIEEQGLKARQAQNDFDNYTPSGISDIAKKADKADEANKQRETLKKMLPGGTDKLAKSVMENAGKGENTASVPSYKKGTDRVPETGKAKIHKDEAVLKKEDANKYRKLGGMEGIMHLAAGELGHGKSEKKPDTKKEVKEMHIRKANGGHIVVHKHARPDLHPDEEHIVPDMDALHDHLEEHMGDENPGENEGMESSGTQQMENMVGME